MNEFAPEYTKKEKIALLLKHAAWAIPLIVSTKYLFFSWFEAYVESAHCYRYGDITGTEVVLYGLFVGFPILFAILLFLFEGPRGIRVLRYGQNPLPGEKVFAPTKYTYGFRAKLKPLLLFIVMAVLIGLSLKGVFAVKQIVSKASSQELSECIGDAILSTYLYSKWKDSPLGCPVEFYSELDDLRYETRKVEVFQGGKLGFACEAAASDDTRLGVIPVPPMSEILEQSEFESKEISQHEFENIWQAAVTAAKSNKQQGSTND